MTRIVFSNGRILVDSVFVNDRALLVENGDILAILDHSDPRLQGAEHHVDLAGDMLLPGFIDIQVNGGGGVLFNDQPTLDGITAIGAAHRRFGTTGFLPTIITDDFALITQAMAAANAAVQTVPGVLGIHVEGPFLNPQRKGVHDAGKIRKIDESAITLLSRPRQGRLLTTLAPEMTSPDMIVRLRDAGIIIAAGHTDGSYEVVTEALDAGITGATHLFNAMSPLTGRQPGAVGAALDHPSCWCSIIVDGHHVAPASLRIALRARGADKMILVTDAMPGVGSAITSFSLQGRPITVADGKCLDENGVLAGSNLDMASAVRNACRWLDIDLPTAVAMASRVPAEFIGLGHRLGRIAPGYQADLVRATDNLDIVGSWIAGKP